MAGKGKKKTDVFVDEMPGNMARRGDSFIRTLDEKSRKFKEPKEEKVEEKKEVIPDYCQFTILNNMKLGETLETTVGLKLRRIVGGFLYETNNGVTFVSSDELRNV